MYKHPISAKTKHKNQTKKLFYREECAEYKINLQFSKPAKRRDTPSPIFFVFFVFLIINKYYLILKRKH